MSNINGLIKELKDNQEDFEFYPTTDEMLQVILEDIKTNNKDGYINNLMDIGAGIGNLYTYFNKNDLNIYHYYIIEKSDILIKNLPLKMYPIGKDFFKINIIDKQVDYIFSNPPYSIFEEWTIKILLEANFKKNIYLIIPDRWINNKRIQDVIIKRNYKYQILYTGDFLDADRQARAKINIIKFSQDVYIENEPFYIFLNEEININENKSKEKDEIYRSIEKEKYDKKEKKIADEIEISKNIVDVLVENYNFDIEKLMQNFKLLLNMDEEILIELNINKHSLISNLKLKIEGLKTFYWRLLFDKLDKINNYLTNQKKNLFLNIINNEKIKLDFNEETIFIVVAWVLKYTNFYIDDQLVDLFKRFTTHDNIKKYKSNQKTWANENWRWNKEEIDNYYLEYRIIINCDSDSFRSYRFQDLKCLLTDILVIAHNLGFNVENNFNYIQQAWSYNYGEKFLIYYNNNKVFCEFKYYKNNNLHLKFDKQFIKAFNIEASRILGWIKNKQDISNEIPELDMTDINNYFNINKNFTINNNNIFLLN